MSEKSILASAKVQLRLLYVGLGFNLTALFHAILSANGNWPLVLGLIALISGLIVAQERRISGEIW
jgi:hypothetical protein